MALDSLALNQALQNIKKKGRRKRVERMLPREDRTELEVSVEMPRQEGPGEAEEGMRRAAGQTLPERLEGRQTALSRGQLEGMERDISGLRGAPTEEQREEQREEEEEAEETRGLSPEGEEILRSIDPAIEMLRRYRSPLER